MLEILLCLGHIPCINSLKTHPSSTGQGKKTSFKLKLLLLTTLHCHSRYMCAEMVICTEDKKVTSALSVTVEDSLLVKLVTS